MKAMLDIEEDILQAAEEIAAKENSTTGKVISRLARASLTKQSGEKREFIMRNGVPVIPSSGQSITTVHVQQFLDEEGQ